MQVKLEIISYLQILSDPQAATYVSGTAVHWYFDSECPVSRLTELRDLFPNKFILYTEASFSKYSETCQVDHLHKVTTCQC